MKSTAILISGHTREYKEYLEDLLFLKDKFNADIFISSYKDKGTGIRFWQGQEQQGELLEEKEFEEINSILTPKYALFTSDILAPDYLNKMSFQNKIVDVPGTFKMLYKIWEANSFKYKYETENKFKYDRVIRTRFDLNYINVDLEDFKEKTVYGARADIKRYASDTFFVCDSNTMDQISQLVNYFGTKIVPKDFHNCEDMLTQWISKLGYDILYGGIDLRLRDKRFN